MRQTTASMFLIGALLFLSRTSALAGDDIDKHRSCVFCGMDRKAYGYSRMLIQYEDGGSSGVCSLHCAVVELDTNKGRAVKALFVAERDSRILIDAEKAVWVMGGKKPGVMTQRPKWAFASPAAAGAFIDTYGGKIVTWSEAFAAAREEVPREH
jgi:copper chaperone NosL